MGNKLKSLFNALCDIETKGQNTITMCDSLRFIQQLIKEADAKDAEIEKLKAEIASLKEKPVTAEDKIEKDEVVETKTE